MKIFLNGLELSKEAEGAVEVGQVLSELQSELHNGGKVLLAAMADGVLIEQGYRRKRQLAMPVNRVTRLDLTIQNAEVVAQQIMKDSLQVLRQIQQETASLATSFRIGDEYNANQRLAEFVEQLKLALQGVSVALQRGRTADSFYAPLHEAVRGLLPAIDRILKAQASGDYVSLADTLEYDLPQHLRECYLALQKLGRQAEFRESLQTAGTN